MMRVCIAVVAALMVSAVAVADSTSYFPRPMELEPDIEFWTRVYTEIDTHRGFIHDSRHLGVVYEIVQFTDGMSRRSRQQHVERAKKHYKIILSSLARGKRKSLSAEEKRVLALWPKGVSNGTLRSAARRLRFQLGQSDKFLAGLVRSGAWDEHVRQVFSERGLPTELALLPHVESSYNPKAYSHRGAAGLWQFMRPTGRRYLRIDRVVDERMDPYQSTVAAAKLLKHNYEVVGTWPLAITAYNHGAAGMRRAVRKLGTRDIATIVRRYNGRVFGFASRNFYVSFLAAVDVVAEAEKHFGPIRRHTPPRTETLSVPAFVSVGTLERTLGVDRATLKASNPALRPAVWNGSKYVPRGYELWVPSDLINGSAATAALAGIASSERFQAQTRDSYHIVRRGDTLSGIAARYDTSIKELASLNHLRSRHRIVVGKKLYLPHGGASRPIEVAASAPSSGVAASIPDDGAYTVRRGDTVLKIAKRFGLEERTLLASNGIRDKHRIDVGQRLRLTAGSTQEVSVVSDEETVPKDHSISMASVESSVESADFEVASAVDGAAEAIETLAVLRADPSDYRVGSDKRIEIHAAETLGHYAEWLQIRTNRLRRVNGMKYGQPVVIGRRLKLDFARVSPEAFEQRRIAYHRSLQEEFFKRFQIKDTHTHVVRPGESLWTLSQRKYRVPVWLLRQYNPDLELQAVRPGMRIAVPEIQRRNLAA